MSRKAMVIEDDFDASVIFAKALEVLGFETEIVRDGAIALEKLAGVIPEIIILDLHLPNVVGTQILRHIRADDRLIETRVIVATADPRSAELIQPMADLVLLKPTTFSQVRDLASRLISMPRSQSKKRQAQEAAPQPVPEVKPEPAAEVKQGPTAEVKPEPTPEAKPEQTPPPNPSI